jgi:hypothetical protein
MNPEASVSLSPPSPFDLQIVHSDSGPCWQTSCSRLIGTASFWTKFTVVSVLSIRLVWSASLCLHSEWGFQPFHRRITIYFNACEPSKTSRPRCYLSLEVMIKVSSSNWGVILTTYLHLEARLKMFIAIRWWRARAATTLFSVRIAACTNMCVCVC